MPQEKSRTNATWTELSCPEYLVQCETDHALGRRPCAQTADGRRLGSGSFCDDGRCQCVTAGTLVTCRQTMSLRLPWGEAHGPAAPCVPCV